MQPKTENTRKDILKMSNIESNLFTKECIRFALLQLLNETPFEKVTITAIINRSGVSRAGFYRNYSSKEAVIEEITSELSQTLSTFLNDELYRDNPRQWLINLFRQIQENKDYFRLLIAANVPHKFIIRMERFFEHFCETNISSERYYFIAVTTSIKEICIDWFKNGMKESPEEMASLIVNIFLYRRS